MVPPFDKAVEMFELTQFNVFTPNLKKGGGKVFPVALPL